MGPIDVRLILLTTLLLTETLTRESFLGATFFSGLHVVAVLLDFFDDVFRLHFSLEAPECILQRFTLLNDNFCHAYSPPSLLVCVIVLLDSHQCNRYTPCPAISNFYPRLSPKSRDKLYKRQSASSYNYKVNGYRDWQECGFRTQRSFGIACRHFTHPGNSCGRMNFGPNESSICWMILSKDFATCL